MRIMSKWTLWGVGALIGLLSPTIGAAQYPQCRVCHDLVSCPAMPLPGAELCFMVGDDCFLGGDECDPRVASRKITPEGGLSMPREFQERFAFRLFWDASDDRGVVFGRYCNNVVVEWVYPERVEQRLRRALVRIEI